MSKVFYKGMNVNQTIYHVLAKLDKYAELFDLHEEVTGNNEAALNAETHKILSKRILNWLLTKNHTLVCQHCGSVHDVQLVSDLRHYGTFCERCIHQG